MMISTLEGTGEWSFGKACHSSDCKNLAMRVSDIHLSHIAIFHPKSGKLYALRPNTLLFGTSTAALRYNVMGRVVGAPVSMILWAPEISFVGDFGFPMRSSISASAMIASRKVAEFHGMLSKDAKTEIGNAII